MDKRMICDEQQKKGSIIDMSYVCLKHNPHDSRLVVPLPLAQ